jgi:hypothetical protein
MQLDGINAIPQTVDTAHPQVRWMTKLFDRVAAAKILSGVDNSFAALCPE